MNFTYFCARARTLRREEKRWKVGEKVFQFFLSFSHFLPFSPFTSVIFSFLCEASESLLEWLKTVTWRCLFIIRFTPPSSPPTRRRSFVVVTEMCKEMEGEEVRKSVWLCVYERKIKESFSELYQVAAVAELRRARKFVLCFSLFFSGEDTRKFSAQADASWMGDYLRYLCCFSSRKKRKVLASFSHSSIYIFPSRCDSRFCCSYCVDCELRSSLRRK